VHERPPVELSVSARASSFITGCRWWALPDQVSRPHWFARARRGWLSRGLLRHVPHGATSASADAARAMVRFPGHADDHQVGVVGGSRVDRLGEASSPPAPDGHARLPEVQAQCVLSADTRRRSDFPPGISSGSISPWRRHPIARSHVRGRVTGVALTLVW